MKKSTSEVKLKGTTKSGYVLTVSDIYGYKDDIALNLEELKMIKDILNKKIK